MTASLSGVFNLQQFTDTGAPAAGYRLYTYAAGTTTQKVAYTDEAASVPHTYTSDGIGGQYIALNARGELPAPLFLTSGGYDIALKTAAGATVWTRRAIGGDDKALAIALDLASNASAAKGTGMSGHGGQIDYPDATAGDALNSIVRVRDYPYLATSNGADDDTAAIQAAVAWAAQQWAADVFSTDAAYTRPRVVKLGPKHKILGKILVPTGVTIDMRGTTLFGSGYTNTDNVCFETAYWNAGVLTSNIGTPPESHRVQFTQFVGGRFINFKKAFNLYNFNEGCSVRDVAFYQCGQAIKAERSFYAEFTQMLSRGSAGGSTDAAYEFSFYVNVENIVNVSVADRALGFLFAGAINGQHLSITAENGTDGARFTGEVNPLLMGAGCYFESLTGIALDFSAASAHRALMVENVWFNLCGTGIKARNTTGGEIGRGCYFLACTTNVDMSDTTSTATVHMPPGNISVLSASLLPTMPAGYSLNPAARVLYPQTVISDVDGSAQARAINPVDHYAELPWFGRSGRVSTKVLWCSVAVVSTGGSNYNVVITTRIAYDVDVALFFSITVVDNVGTYKLCGNAAGPTIYASSVGGKAAFIDADSNGYVRLTLSTFSHPTGVISATGAVRMQ